MYIAVFLSYLWNGSENELCFFLKTREVLELHSQQRPLALSRKSVEIVEALTLSENWPKFILLWAVLNKEIKHIGLPGAWLLVVQVIPRQPSCYLYSPLCISPLASPPPSWCFPPFFVQNSQLSRAERSNRPHFSHLSSSNTRLAFCSSCDAVVLL